VSGRNFRALAASTSVVSSGSTSPFRAGSNGEVRPEAHIGNSGCYACKMRKRRGLDRAVAPIELHPSPTTTLPPRRHDNEGSVHQQVGQGPQPRGA
jgi:hypothetical protein